MKKQSLPGRVLEGNTKLYRVLGKLGRFSILGFALLLMLCVGCSESEHPLAPVSGNVLYKGEPLEQGTISFLSSETRQATGEIVDGKIVNVTTFSKNDGAPIGELKVAITAFDRSEEHRNSMVPPSLIPRHYANHTTSKLTATIVAGETNELQFDLE